MPRLFRILFAFTVISLLLGCSLPGAGVSTPVPAADALPAGGATGTPGGGGDTTQTSAPPEASATEPATASAATPTLNATQRNAFTITPSATLDSNNVVLRIAAPGPMSKVISPIDFAVYIAPDYTGVTRIQLLGEDGRELYTKAFRTFSNIGSATRVTEQINFEIHGAAEVGRLQVSTIDQFGLLQAFNSVRVLLMSVGDNELTPALPPLERVLLRTPKQGDEVGGGSLTVTGQIQPVNDTPVVLELYDTSGVSIGSRILTLQPADGTYQSFSTVIPYKIDKKIVARLMIHQNDDRIAGLAYLYSLDVLIDP